MQAEIFPWREGNRFRLLIDGGEFFPRMLAAIEAAGAQVDLELYLLQEGACASRLVDSLCGAARRGAA